MEQVPLEGGLSAWRCRDSGGHYIPADAYWRWLHRQPGRLPHLPPPPDGAPPTEETSTPKLCPETGTLMLRFKVGYGFPFSIDRSITGGIWLDSGEWEALRARHFHDELHLVFTAPWQAAIRNEAARKGERDLLETRFGADLMTQIDTLKARLADHPHRNAALAYLQRV